MKKLIILGLLALVACETKPHITWDLSFEKAADECTEQSTGMKMNSNLNGERYEFQLCLDPGFTKSQMHCVQRGNVVDVTFERTTDNLALFNLVFDLDVFPRYDTLIIDGNPISIKPYEP